MGMAWAPISAAWTPMRPGTSVSPGSDIGATTYHRCHCSVTSVPSSLGLCSASCWLWDLSDAAFMTSPEVKIASKVPSPGRREIVFMEEQSFVIGFGLDPDSGEASCTGIDPTSSSGVADVPTTRGEDGSVPRTSVPNADDVLLEPEAVHPTPTGSLDDPMRSSYRGDDYPMSSLPIDVPGKVSRGAGMALIAGFPSKDDHFENRFFFTEISERTVEADCIDLVKTRWERRVKPSLPGVSKEFLAAMHKELSSGNGNARKSFSRKRIERAFSAEILLGKILGRGQARVSFREQAALEAAVKAKGPSDTITPRVATPTTSTSPAPSVRARSSRPLAPRTVLPPPSSGDVAEFRRLSAERARISSGKGKDVDCVTPSKRQRVDAFPAAAVGGEASASRVGGLLRDKAYSVVKSRYSELSLLFDRLVGDYDEDVRSRGSELSAAKEANAALQSRLDETVEQNEALERDALALQKIKKDYDDKLAKLKLRCTKAEGEAVQLRGELSSASDLQRSRIDDAIAEVRDEMTRSLAERTSEVAGLLAEIGGKAQNDMLNLTEIGVNLEFIGLLQGSEPPDLLTEVKALCGRRHPIYDAHDVYADLLASVRRALEIHVVSAGTGEASVAVDDDVEVSDEDDVEAIDDDENAED
ncbi:hypothetical protein AALP_AA6G230200 [Arabis alpina]|uniref:Uncharacterized protein n=1 Tax=Arabis alpina TaxID=50452 RepID=A0A087GR48_ARAAL|nr:hypothetical protein AALP_AA6G230200 [Arabis alpina]